MSNAFALPVVGDGASYSIGSDRYPATVIKVTAKTVTIQDDNYKATPDSNYFGAQDYIFSPNPNGKVQIARWSEKRQRWLLAGRATVGFNGRSAYQDPSF